ncbi:hypothetical protein BT63DRAFT_367821 [Microthyrium microscopicum]|uniref:Protein-lysine N-methyltransferase EFM6 n=1 Tax=Microthyrium microscopicum TaxID=703497 RepID=A0A6A6UN67_9PEZI|nr:hypothetical protein BT63DRAFT_367821 [Microthyrium microscopicum]
MSDNELDEKEPDFFNFSEDLVELPQIKQAGTAALDFDGLLSEELKLHEDLTNGCGGQLWPAGMVLSKYMLRKFGHGGLENKTIVEIGAGGGLVGLAVAKGCHGFQAPMYITDQVNMLELMKQNILKNDLTQLVQAKVYDWGEACPSDMPSQPDIILAADCVYFEPAFPLLEKTLVDLIGDNSVCYFCFKKRRRADMHFIKSIKKSFNVTLVDDDPDTPTYSKENISL